MTNYNIWNKWDRLKTVMLGDHYRAEFFDPIKNTKVRDSLKRIADETQEDLDYFERVLKDFGCTVIRPELNHKENILDYVNINGEVTGAQGVPRSPLQVRDMQFVAGNKLYYTGEDHPSIRQTLNRYNPQSQNLYIQDIFKWHPIVNERRWNSIAGDDWLSYKDYLQHDYFNRVPEFVKKEHEIFNGWNEVAFAPSVTVVGRDVYVDGDRNPYAEIHRTRSLYVEHILGRQFRINYLNHGGHSDGCFHTLKPGALITLKEIQNYENTFPNWDVCYLPDQSWDKVKGFLKLKHHVEGKWWVPGEEDNIELTTFVETWLQDWVGYVEETVFDVNVLVLDQHHVCVSQNDNKEVNTFLKKHKMEPIYIPWRHRYFWDGGLHCITLDLEREGVQQDYFPQRGIDSIIDNGFE